MSTLTLIRRIISPFLFLNIIRRYKGRTALIKIKAAQAYVAGVQKIRVLFLGILFVIFAFLLLGSGLFLVHTAFFTYSLWSSQVKFIVALVLGGIEFSGAIIILFYLSREETWGSFLGVQNMVNSVIEGNSDKKVK